MKKLLSIVLALTLVLTSLPVFAYGEEGFTGGENLKANDFIKGDENGNLNEEKELTRQELAIIMATIHGVFDEAKEFAGENIFADADAFAGWAKPFIGYAGEKGWFTGDEKKNFNPLNVVSDEELAIVMLRALGYEPVAWGGNIELLTNKTNIEIAQSKQLTRGQAFDALWIAVSTNVAADGSVLGVTLGKLQPATPDKLEITNVAANNLKEIFVNFNQPVKDVTKDNFKLSDNVKIASVEVSENVVVITVDGNLKEKEYTLTADKVSALAEGVDFEKSDVKFSPLDKERPEVEEIEFAGPKTIMVTFSEPVQVSGGKVTVKQDKATISVNTAKISSEGRKIIVPLFGTLQENKEYTITIKDFKDYNNLPNIPKEETLTFVKDTTSPEVEVAEITQEYMVVKFTKPVKGLEPKLFHHTFTKYEAVKLYKEDGKTEIGSTDAVTYAKVVFFAGKPSDTVQPLAAGNVKIMIDGDTIKDLWGNKLGNFEDHFTVVADDVKPEVVSTSLESETEILVTFSEDVTAVKNNFSVKDKDGKAILVKIEKGETAKEILVTFAAGQANKDITLKITGVKDKSVNENKMEDYSEVITVIDKTKPEVKQVTHAPGTYDADGNPVDGKVGKLYVFYNEDVDATAVTITNYQVLGTDGVYTRLTNSASFFEGTKVVVIELTKAQNTKFAAGAKLYIEGVKDLAGNTIVSKAHSVNVHDTATAIAVEEDSASLVKVYATEPNVVKVTFNQDIYDVKTDKITVAGGDPAQAIESAVVDGNKVVITLKKPLTNIDNAAAIADKISFDENALKGTFTNDEYKNATISALQVYNKVAPAIKTNDDGNIIGVTAEAGGRIVAEFTRFVQNPSEALVGLIFELRYNDEVISVTKYTHAVVNNKIAFVLDPTVAKDGKYTLKLTNNGEFLAEGAANPDKVAVKNFEFELENVDFTGPKVTKAVKGATDNILILTMSEALHTVNGGTVGAAVADGSVADYLNVTGTSVAPITGAEYKAADKTITITFAVAPTDADVEIEFKEHSGTSLCDAAGNKVNESSPVVTNEDAVSTNWANYTIK